MFFYIEEQPHSPVRMPESSTNQLPTTSSQKDGGFEKQYDQNYVECQESRFT